MIAQVHSTSHGAAMTNYAMDKAQAEIVDVHLLPDDLSPSALWGRMMLHARQTEGMRRGNNVTKNWAIRIELSPSKEETIGWTLQDWKRLAEELQRQIQQLERTRETVDNSITYLKVMQKQLSDTLNAFNAAEGSADNIINGIVAQICKVEHTRFTAHLDEASVSQAQETNRKVIDHEKEVLEAHLRKEADMWSNQAYKMQNILSKNEGVWMSSKLFYIIAPFTLLPILTVVMYISLWVYLNWIV